MSKGTQSRRRAPPRRKPLLKPYRRSTLLAKRKQQGYTIGTIKALLQKHSTLGPCSSDREFARKENVPIATLRGWLARKEEFLQSKKHTSNATLSGHGHSEAVDFGDALASFMDSVRDHEKFLTTAHLVTWLKNHQPAWLDSYLEGKVDPSRAYKALLGWCQDFAHRHGFSQRVPCASKRTQEDLQATRIEYAQSFWSRYGAYDRGNIINIDETGVHYDMPPRRTWARIGKSAKVDRQQKHSDRVTAVLAIRADGRKLPPCIIVRGQPGGPVEQDELPTYPRDAIYAVQENAWMDERVWDIYLRELVQYEIEGPSVVVVDNLSAHVTPAACELVRGDLYSVLEELPANATSTVQPLDVGVMGPFKAKCRTEWLHEVKVTTAAEKRLAMVKRILKVWESIPPAMVIRSFDKAIPCDES
ncbi:hypothetical protein H257_03179 [Aphanomyces astaci]|uniref:DDE-1 domain-containing protein n=1 Tax=Aphanomyces astaci TaxID=112090 RepID=W4H0B0_APHAT|nr:hypothetical protein H257_03179 [Aphanomyces astaci]ETV85440.1 hypothetical protein H257_03179 [Aphanomyces astaci]|eukprot:XP_009825458.1 hypothetical protein H257_03179 [Aphanomyces astaci]